MKVTTTAIHLLSERQIDGEDVVKFCGLLRKQEL